MIMVSIGPQIEFPHSPDERVPIPRVGEFYTLWFEYWSSWNSRRAGRPCEGAPAHLSFYPDI
jgi:hypothetical protein